MGKRTGASAVALASIAAVLLPAPVRAASPVRIGAAFDQGAKLGDETALNVGLHIDTRRAPSPVTAIRLSYARGLGLVSSSLGLATCTRPAIEFQDVLGTGTGLGGCPRNSVIAYGTARATVRLVQSGQVIPEYATLTVLTGPIEDGRLKLVIYIDGQRPFGARLVLAGEAVETRGPYGGALVVRFPQVASLRDVAVINLTDLNLAIGSPRIRYQNRRGPYRPGGIALPQSCSRDGFQFSVSLDFQDGSRRTDAAVVPCPRSANARGQLRAGSRRDAPDLRAVDYRRV